MAEVRKTFPMLPVGHWWTLRKKFKQSIPGVVTDNYLATVLEMGVESSRANVLPFLKPLGIIDDEGKPTERAKLWRDDGHYPEVCNAIVAEIYPRELLDAVPNPREARDTAKRWFANHTGVGDSACGRMAALYTLLKDADPAAQPDGKSPKPKERQPKQKPGSTSESTTDLERPKNDVQPSTTTAISSQPLRADGPDVSINLQIHISADASPDQIEQIFAAMAKHIYKRG